MKVDAIPPPPARKLAINGTTTDTMIYNTFFSNCPIYHPQKEIRKTIEISTNSIPAPLFNPNTKEVAYRIFNFATSTLKNVWVSAKFLYALNTSCFTFMS